MKADQGNTIVRNGKIPPVLLFKTEHVFKEEVYFIDSRVKMFANLHSS